MNKYFAILLMVFCFLLGTRGYAVQTGGLGFQNPEIIGDKLTISSTLEVTSGYLTLGGVSYRFPVLMGTTESFLKNDGAGNLTWETLAGNLIPVGVEGSIQYKKIQGMDNLFFGDTDFIWTPNNKLQVLNARVGIGTAAPTVSLEVIGGDVKIGTLGASIESSTGKFFHSYLF